MRFDEILYNDELLDALYDMHFSECTPIQEKAIPAVEQGRDVLALAQTGTGKTAAYLLPIIDFLADGGYPEDAVNCLVMVPTRELAMQIDQQMQGFSYFLPRISSALIYGGNDAKNYDTQKQALVKGADVVIATPGRLIAHLQMGYVDLSRVSFFVLDEADRMLDMGFVEDIKNIMSYLPKEKQTLMFSATISPKIKKLATQLLVDPVEIKIALSKPPETIDQQAYMVTDQQKERLLRHVLRDCGDDLTLVFASSKLNVKSLARTLRSWGVKSTEIHSDLEQAQREEAILDFRSGRKTVLVATDIVSRGIDIDNITTIVNYDVPHDAEDYVHRIGRTARASKTGRAITFVAPKDRERFRRIEQLIEKKVPRCPLPDGFDESAASDKPSKSKSSRSKSRSKSRPKSSHKQAPAPSGTTSSASVQSSPVVTAPALPTAATGESKSKRHRGGRYHRRKKSGEAPSTQPSAE